MVTAAPTRDPALDATPSAAIAEAPGQTTLPHKALGGPMLLVLPVPLRESPDGLLFEEQACNGALRWADNFSRVTIASPVIPERYTRDDRTTMWKSVREVEANPRVRFVPLPWAYGLKDFARSYRQISNQLAQMIDDHQHLQFAIGALVGDWAAVGAGLAAGKGRKYAIHTDRVEHEVLLEVSKGDQGLRRAKALATAWAIRNYHKHLIERCSLGLWHGNDCFRAYSPWCRESHLIHDIHLKAAHAIEPSALQQKLVTAVTAPTLEICYLGRMDPMKAPLDWLRAIAFARDHGAAIHATWYGDGSLRDDVHQLIAELQLEQVVTTPGFVRDRALLMNAVQRAHLTVFTHVTPESPRCLLESLVAGTPIVGYKNAFAVDLTNGHGGGSFVPVHDWQALGERIVELAADRRKVADFIQEAAENGRRFNDDAVFLERSELIRAFA
jgi:glycosyltransferase involved in cell wall biosynthesis